MNLKKLKAYLDEKVTLYNKDFFIESDPIQIPHRYSKLQDIEIAALFSATIAWGNRKSIITNASRLMEFMDNDPYNFIQHHKPSDLKRFSPFVHRTFHTDDVLFFIEVLKTVYTSYDSLQHVFVGPNGMEAIEHFRNFAFSIPHLARSEKHISSPAKKSAAKRLNMFLRWMVRKDEFNIDFGVWNQLQPKDLFIPLDVHTATVARKLGILTRKQNDRAAVEELTHFLAKLDANDPVKYDYALFGIGAFEKQNIDFK